jgi:hypothetical protein
MRWTQQEERYEKGFFYDQPEFRVCRKHDLQSTNWVFLNLLAFLKSLLEVM